MIKVYVKPVPPEAVENVHPVANNGVRMAATVLGRRSISTTEAIAIAQAALRGERSLLAKIQDEHAGRIAGAQQIIARYGFELVAERNDELFDFAGDPEDGLEGFHAEASEADAENQDSEPPTDPGKQPSYVASLVSLSILGTTNGDVTAAVRLTNTIRYAYKTQDPDGLEVWDDVLRILFDAFPPHDSQAANSIQELAAEVGR